ncbi:MAG: hypothetical protein ACR2RF_23760 [Geminicoccaceae bacterium]
MPATRTVSVPDDVKAVLANAIIGEDRLTLPDQLDRPLYIKVDKVLKAAGGKWNTSAGAHLFKADPRQVLGMAMETGTIVDDKKSRQAFYTPEWLAKQLCDAAGIDDTTDRVLEPSAGDGSLVKAAVAEGSKSVLAVETDERECAKLKLLGLRSHHVTVFNIDFMELSEIPEPFDACVMNPPFDHYVEHFNHARAMVKPEGLIASIVPRGIEFRQDKKIVALREAVKASGGWITNLPERAFEGSGTSFRTSMIVAPGTWKAQAPITPKQLILL